MGTVQQQSVSLAAPVAQSVGDSLRRLDAWLGQHDYRGYDPFDGLSSVLRPLTFGSKFLRQCLLQLVRRCPLNVRPFVGIRPAQSTKGMGFLARGYLRWNAVEPNPMIATRAATCLDWLRGNGCRGYSGYCWGNHFDYQARLFYLPQGTPTVVWTALIGLTFVEAFERTGETPYFQVARSACDFVLRDLARIPGERGCCISYIPTAAIVVHNSNALAAALLARVYQHTQEAELKRIAHEALTFTAYHQNPDGGWYYGPAANLHWIDNWHTAYVLDSFDEYARGTGDRSFEQVCRKGWEFFRHNFFLADGTPKFYVGRVHPIDIQCPSQALETLCRFRSWDPTAVPLAARVALWTIANMQAPDGYFYFQRGRHWVNKTATIHWGQATMLSGLATLLQCCEEASRE